MAVNPLVKQTNLNEQFTEHMLKEMVRCAQDGISEDYGIIYFIRTYCKIQHPIKGSIPFDLFDYQVRMLDCYVNNRWSITLSARQCGKTETAAAYLVWRSVFRSNQKILIASKDHAGAKDIMKRFKHILESLPEFLKPGTTIYNVHTVEFDNGSEVFATATTESTGRGRSISCLMLDEFAFVNPRVAEEFFTAILPTISTGGDMLITSTPNTDTDKFSAIWHGALADQNGFSYVEVKWNEHPDRDDKFRSDTIAKIGELKWRREYNNEFLSDAETLISAIRMAIWDHKKPLIKKNNFKFWQSLTKDQRYVIGVDVGTGTGGDYSTIQCFSFPQLEQIAEFRENTLSTPQLTLALVWLLRMIDKAEGVAYYSVESNGVGEGVIASFEQLEEAKNIEIPGTMFHDTGKGKRGFYTSNKRKLAACMELKTLLDTDKPRMTIHSRILMTEFKFYVRSGASFAARLGITDDLIAALVIMVRVMQEAVQYDDIDIESIYADDDLYDDDEDDIFGIII